MCDYFGEEDLYDLRRRTPLLSGAPETIPRTVPLFHVHEAGTGGPHVDVATSSLNAVRLPAARLPRVRRLRTRVGHLESKTY